MLNIELDVFSGVPNPQWSLEVDSTNELMQMVLDGGLEVMSPDHEVPLLGYRGFRVKATGSEAETLRGEGVPESFYVPGQRGSQDALSVDAQLMLLAGVVQVQDEVYQHAFDRIVEFAQSSAVAGVDGDDVPNLEGEEDHGEEMWSESEEYGSPVAVSGSVEAAGCMLRTLSNHDFSFWNGAQHVRLNNCYNYGSAWRTNTFAQPGRGGTGKAFWEKGAMSAGNCLRGCLDDGLVRWNPCNGTEQFKLAIVVWPGVDYHFYRRVRSDRAGRRWAHKPGKTRARNTDNSGRFIRSPFACDRGGYTEWGGYVYRLRDGGFHVR